MAAEIIWVCRCRYSSPYSDEGEAPQAGMLEAPAPTPLLASRSPERPGHERAALLPKVLGDFFHSAGQAPACYSVQA